MWDTELGWPWNPSTSPVVGAGGAQWLLPWAPHFPTAAAPSLPVLSSRASALLLRRSSRSRGLSVLPPSCSTSCRCPAVALQSAACVAAHVPAAPRVRHASPLPSAIAPCEGRAGLGPSAVTPGSLRGSAPPCRSAVPQACNGLQAVSLCPASCTVLVLLSQYGLGAPWSPPAPVRGVCPPCSPPPPPAGEAAQSCCECLWGGTGPRGAVMQGALAQALQAQRLQHCLDPAGRGCCCPPPPPPYRWVLPTLLGGTEGSWCGAGGGGSLDPLWSHSPTPEQTGITPPPPGPPAPGALLPAGTPWDRAPLPAGV